MKNKVNIIFDMETGDPDDLWTLYFLLSNPKVNLKAVTVVPGSPEQIGLVKSTLEDFGCFDIDVGSNDPDSKYTLSNFYSRHYNFKPCYDKILAEDVLAYNCDENTILLTGGPPKNVGKVLTKYNDCSIGTWVAQGGFAGDNIVPKELRMEKFNGMITCPTFNLNGAPIDTLLALNSNCIKNKYFVSKNVCHSVVYDEEMHEMFKQNKGNSKFVDMMIDVMPRYLKKDHNKKLHDLLAAACAIDLSIGEFVEAKLFRDKNKWGCKNKEEANPNCNIIINYNKEKFLDILLEKSI